MRTSDLMQRMNSWRMNKMKSKRPGILLAIGVS
jgi:hypothetical protein